MSVRHNNKVLSWLIVLAAVCSQSAFSQQEYRININSFQRDINKNFIGVPVSADCILGWDLYSVNNKNDIERLSPAVLDSFMVIVAKNGENQENDRTITVQNTNVCTIEQLPANQPYQIYVYGYLQGTHAVVSDTVSMTLGRISAFEPSKTDSRWNNWWILISGRLLTSILGVHEYFDGATSAGQIAFHLIWNFLLLGLLIWLVRCVFILKLDRIFPLQRGLSFKPSDGYDKILFRRIDKEFKDKIIEKWKEVIRGANTNLKNRLQEERKNSESIQDCIDQLNTEYWLNFGSDQINSLNNLIDQNKWDKKYSTVRILHAGLKNHELGGYHLSEVSKEVDRAIENRASAELEKLRRKSLLDWLWNLGTLSPLIGLLGTATGISNAFFELSKMGADLQENERINVLADGIYEALWTTILGLGAGIFLMLLYYYYNNKLKTIYSKWEEMYVHISETL